MKNSKLYAENTEKTIITSIGMQFNLKYRKEIALIHI